MSLLFSPMTIRSRTFRNRLWVAPMCQYSAEADGVPGDWHLVHYAQYASGGAGLIITEATAVVPEGRISTRDAGLWNDAQRDAWTTVVRATHDRGALIGIQLAHAGRKASAWWPFHPESGNIPADQGGWTTVGPSAIAFEGFAVPEPLDGAGIEQVVQAFGDAARRAVEAGFDVIEVHGAHGYLLHEFLSPLSNHRDDEYGGSLENRARLLLRVVEAVRAAAGDDIPVFVRISASDHAEGGFDLDDSSRVAAWVIEHGADLVDVSTGALVAHQHIVVGPGYQVPLAAEIRERGGVPTTAVGIITSGPQAEEVLASGAADAIFAGREWLRDPHFGLRAAHELGATVEWPDQYVRAAWR